MMNGDSGAIISAIANKSRSATFIDDFLYWRATRFMKITAKDINMKFKELTEACDVTSKAKATNFNYVVDEILQTTMQPPSVCASVFKPKSYSEDFMTVINKIDYDEE